MKNKFFLILPLILIIGVLLFYWFEYRPYQIRKSCYKELENRPGEIGILTDDTYCDRTFEGNVSCVKHDSAYERFFRICLNHNGLNE